MAVVGAEARGACTVTVTGAGAVAVTPPQADSEDPTTGTASMAIKRISITFDRDGFVGRPTGRAGVAAGVGAAAGLAGDDDEQRRAHGVIVGGLHGGVTDHRTSRGAAAMALPRRQCAHLRVARTDPQGRPPATSGTESSCRAARRGAAATGRRRNACGCREPGHIMRPADTRVPGRRGGLVVAAERSRRRAGEWGLRAGADQVIGVGGACCSGRRTRAAPA